MTRLFSNCTTFYPHKIAVSRAIWHRLSIPFRTVVCFTEHLAILLGSCSTFTPCRNVISIHLVELVDFSLICFMPHCTVWAVGNPRSLSLSQLNLELDNEEKAHGKDGEAKECEEAPARDDSDEPEAPPEKPSIREQLRSFTPPPRVPVGAGRAYSREETL